MSEVEELCTVCKNPSVDLRILECKNCGATRKRDGTMTHPDIMTMLEEEKRQQRAELSSRYCCICNTVFPTKEDYREHHFATRCGGYTS